MENCLPVDFIKTLNFVVYEFHWEIISMRSVRGFLRTDPRHTIIISSEYIILHESYELACEPINSNDGRRVVAMVLYDFRVCVVQQVRRKFALFYNTKAIDDLTQN